MHETYQSLRIRFIGGPESCRTGLCRSRIIFLKSPLPLDLVVQASLQKTNI